MNAERQPYNRFPADALPWGNIVYANSFEELSSNRSESSRRGLARTAMAVYLTHRSRLGGWFEFKFWKPTHNSTPRSHKSITGCDQSGTYRYIGGDILCVVELGSERRARDYVIETVTM